MADQAGPQLRHTVIFEWSGESPEATVECPWEPDDPDRPGQKKAILKQGDTYKDKEGLVHTVQSEVLFANARVRYFVDPSRSR